MDRGSSERATSEAAVRMWIEGRKAMGRLWEAAWEWQFVRSPCSRFCYGIAERVGQNNGMRLAKAEGAVMKLRRELVRLAVLTRRENVAGRTLLLGLEARKAGLELVAGLTWLNSRLASKPVSSVLN